MTRRRKDPVDCLSAIDARTEEELTRSLKTALRPEPLDPARNAEILAQALEDPSAPATERELAQAERLRDALAGDTEHPEAELAALLRAAYSPSNLSETRAKQLVERAIALPTPPHHIRFRFGSAAAALALAAGLALVVTQLFPWTLPQPERPRLVRSRSTATLFRAKFQTMGTSERVDTIALARARDLRENRFAGWGVP